MTSHFSPPSHDAGTMPTMLIEAARCWREARDTHQPPQPNLFAMLSRYGHGMLAPVFDSLMTLAESVLGKPIATGNGSTLSKDEHALIHLFDGPGLSSGNSGLAVSLSCAVKSLRIMLARPTGTSTALVAA